MILQQYHSLRLYRINKIINQEHIIYVLVTLRIHTVSNSIGSELCHITIGKIHFILTSIKNGILVFPIDVSLDPEPPPLGESVPFWQYNGSV